MKSLLRALCLRAMLIRILFTRYFLSRCFELCLKSLARFPELCVLVTVRRHCVETFHRLFHFRAHANTIGRELNEQNSVIFRRNERRPIRAWKARRQGEREEMNRSTNRLNDGETRGCYSRHLHLYGVSSEHCARYARAHNVSRVLLKLLANDIDGVGWQLE